MLRIVHCCPRQGGAERRFPATPLRQRPSRGPVRCFYRSISRALLHIFADIHADGGGRLLVHHDGVLLEHLHRHLADGRACQHLEQHVGRLGAQIGVVDAHGGKAAVVDHAVGRHIHGLAGLDCLAGQHTHGAGDGVVDGGKDGVALGEQRLGGRLHVAGAGHAGLGIADALSVQIGLCLVDDGNAVHLAGVVDEAEAVWMQYNSQCRLLSNVSSNCFYPAPKVESALVEVLVTKNDYGLKNDVNFLKFLQGIFSQRRKTLSNNLFTYYGLQKEKTKQMFNQFGWKELVRAEELSVKELIDLYQYLSESDEIHD